MLALLCRRMPMAVANTNKKSDTPAAAPTPTVASSRRPEPLLLPDDDGRRSMSGAAGKGLASSDWTTPVALWVSMVKGAERI
jgi:hypothetical protein